MWLNYKLSGIKFGNGSVVWHTKVRLIRTGSRGNVPRGTFIDYLLASGAGDLTRRLLATYGLWVSSHQDPVPL